MPKQQSNSGFTLVELMVVVAIIGILSSIAIPAFLRYIKVSKASEAEGIMKKMAEGAKTYFLSEQRFSEPTGIEPWHVAGTGEQAPGLPVPFETYVFPGSTAANINTAEPECTGGGLNGVGAPTGGAKVIPCLGVQPPTGSFALAAVNKLRANVTDPLYFKYYYETEEAGAIATATVAAIADFVVGGPSHTVTQFVSVGTSQDVLIGPAAVRHELE